MAGRGEKVEGGGEKVEDRWEKGGVGRPMTDDR
jgi:hypothetical protein